MAQQNINQYVYQKYRINLESDSMDMSLASDERDYKEEVIFSPYIIAALPLPPRILKPDTPAALVFSTSKALLASVDICATVAVLFTVTDIASDNTPLDRSLALLIHYSPEYCSTLTGGAFVNFYTSIKVLNIVNYSTKEVRCQILFFCRYRFLYTCGFRYRSLCIGLSGVATT